MADMPSMIGRPMPVQNITVGRLSIPVPFHFMPEPGDRVANLALRLVIAIKVLACREQALDHKCRLDQVAAIIVFAEIRVYASSATIEEVRPRPVEAVGPLKESQYLAKSIYTVVTCDKSSLGSCDLGHDAKPRCSDGHKI